MAKNNIVIVASLLIAISLGCKSFMPAKTETGNAPPVDFTTPSAGVDVKVALDKKHSSSETIGAEGGSVSLTSADGSKFTLDVPANALDEETEITMTAVKTLDGAPLDTNTPIAVQLEPSGLIFDEALTLTITPSKQIPIEQQIIFGYEGDGKDFHAALVDPNSMEINVKLFGFSGAGVGIGSGSSWAALSGMQVSSAKTRLIQKFAEVTQAERRARERGETPKSSKEILKPFLDAFEEQVVKLKIAAAERDCKHAELAMIDLMFLERMLQLAGFADSGTGSPKYKERTNHLREIDKKCQKGSFQIVGGLDDWQTSTKVCDIMKPFTLTGGGFQNKFSGGLSGTYQYSGPFNTSGSGTYTISLPDGFDKPGTMTGTGDGSAEGAIASGTEKYTLTPIPPCQ